MVRRAENEHDMQQVLQIRQRVFVAEQGVPAELEQDDDDALALHWLAWEGEKPVATARMLMSESRAKIGRVAVLPQARGNGVGRLLMQTLHQKAREEHLEQIYLDAQLQVIPFYESLGYQVEGEVFEDCGILHRRMVLWLG